MRDRYGGESGPERALFGVGCDRSTVVKSEMSDYGFWCEPENTMIWSSKQSDGAEHFIDYRSPTTAVETPAPAGIKMVGAGTR